MQRPRPGTPCRTVSLRTAPGICVRRSSLCGPMKLYDNPQSSTDVSFRIILQTIFNEHLSNIAKTSATSPYDSYFGGHHRRRLRSHGDVPLGSMQSSKEKR